ncbi:hypothetical protein EVAR_65018_1 [Eumeta japonica]|uniref:Uncharacterized protein n=1 Tax=Eumeta variegata TaxID=151549 RepID=A0A4C2A157_EUMVA|nr:hypothetical protein EVAR_65018_1 [Eumeta japonica]
MRQKSTKEHMIHFLGLLENNKIDRIGYPNCEHTTIAIPSTVTLLGRRLRGDCTRCDPAFVLIANTTLGNRWDHAGTGRPGRHAPGHRRGECSANASYLYALNKQIAAASTTSTSISASAPTRPERLANLWTEYLLIELPTDEVITDLAYR